MNARTDSLTRPSRPVTFPKPLILVVTLLLEGCDRKRVPSLDVFGSYFPAWLISLAAGIVLTIVVGGVSRLLDLRMGGLPAFILNVSLILIFSILFWFWFFAS